MIIPITDDEKYILDIKYEKNTVQVLSHHIIIEDRYAKTLIDTLILTYLVTCDLDRETNSIMRGLINKCIMYYKNDIDNN